jgi:hypothetical protein
MLPSNLKTLAWKHLVHTASANVRTTLDNPGVPLRSGTKAHHRHIRRNEPQPITAQTWGTVSGERNPDVWNIPLGQWVSLCSILTKWTGKKVTGISHSNTERKKGRFSLITSNLLLFDSTFLYISPFSLTPLFLTFFPWPSPPPVVLKREPPYPASYFLRQDSAPYCTSGSDPKK